MIGFISFHFCLAGTLVHFEKYFQGKGIIIEEEDIPNGDVMEQQGTATATYKCIDLNSQFFGETRVCTPMPTLTMGPGVISKRSLDMIESLRNDHGIIFVYISGARKSTMLKRLPLLAPADYAFAETGGRMYKLIDGNNENPILDIEWTNKIEAVSGPMESQGDLPLEERQGLLWDWCRELVAKLGGNDKTNCVDIRQYTCCFRVDCSRQVGSEEIVKKALTKLPSGITCAQNLGKYDFFPTISGKGNAVRHLLEKLGLSRDNAVALFDDENDLPMANACSHACVMGCTHESIATHLQQNPHWHVAKQSGVLATEEILQLLLDHVQEGDSSSSKVSKPSTVTAASSSLAP